MDRVSPGLLQALWLCPNDSGHGWARPPPQKGCEAGLTIYITYLWHFGCPLELDQSYPEQTRGDSFYSPTDTIQVRPAPSTLTMRVFSFFELCKEKLSFKYPQEYYVTQTYLTLGGFHKAIWTSQEVDFLENTLLTMQLQENVLKCMYQHLNTWITKCNSSQLLIKIRMNFFLSFFGLCMGGYYVCFNQHRPFDEKDSWHHLLQDSMKTKASSLYLHVGAELIKVSVSVFFNFLWSING